VGVQVPAALTELLGSTLGPLLASAPPRRPLTAVRPGQPPPAERAQVGLRSHPFTPAWKSGVDVNLAEA
jgi:hypothetical protein